MYSKLVISIMWLFHSSYTLNERKYGKVSTFESVKNKLWLIYIWNKAAFLFPAATMWAVTMSEIHGLSPSITMINRFEWCRRPDPEAILQEAEQGSFLHIKDFLPALSKSKGQKQPWSSATSYLPPLKTHPSTLQQTSHQIPRFPFRKTWTTLISEQRDNNIGKVHGRNK